MSFLAFIWNNLGRARAGFVLAMGATLLDGACLALQAMATGLALAALARGVDTTGILPFCALFLIAFMGRLIATCIAWAHGFAAGNRVAESARNRIIDHMRATPLGIYQRWSAARLAALVSEDGRWITEAATFTLNRIVSGLAAALILLGIAVGLAPAIGLAVLAVFLLCLLLAPGMNRTVRRLLAARSERLVALSLRIGEYGEGIAVFRAFRRAGAAFARLNEAVNALRDLMLSATWRLVPLQEATAALFSLGVPVALAVLAAGLIPADQAAPGRLVPALFAALAAREALVNSVLHQALIARLGLLAHERILSFLAEPRLDGGQLRIPEDTSITVRDLAFRYGPDRPPALEGIDFDAPAGLLTAIVGPSGAGKTTLVALLMRFFDPDHGEIRLGGVDIAGIDPARLMSRIAYVGQDVHLFRDTLRANLLLGDPMADEARLRAAIAAAQLEEIVAALPDGLETRIGEGGRTLSGGERQRVSIARAILKDAPVVILDEATSAVDPLSEEAIRRALAALTPGRTVIVIAHRLRMIAGADRIHVMEAGRIVEHGRHDELLARGGLYTRLWDAQRRASGWRIRA